MHLHKKVQSVFFFSLGTQLYGAMMIAKNFPVFKWVKMMSRGRTCDEYVLKGVKLYVSFRLPLHDTKLICTLLSSFICWIELMCTVQVWSQEGYRCKWLYQSNGELLFINLPIKFEIYYVL